MVMGELTQETELLVIGGGPGGYAAAFRAADLGMDVTLVEADPSPGGVCLFRGCIPSKTLLFLTELLHDAGRSDTMGIRFGKPEIDLAAIRTWKDEVVQRLAKGLMTLCRQRGVQVMQARAVFEDSQRVRLSAGDVTHIKFRHAILATGSRPIELPAAKQGFNERLMDSTTALALGEIPETLLVVGGGYVGLELGMVYGSLGSRVTLVELGDRLLPGMDRDLVKPLEQRVNGLFAAVHLRTWVERMLAGADSVSVDLEGEAAAVGQRFDRVLVAIGRRPNTADLGLEHTGVTLDSRGFVQIDEQQRTTAPHIYAVGDLTGGMMLAHKAMREGRVAAEAIAGQPSAFDVRAIPAVVYTDPQVAVCGVSEEQAQAAQIPHKMARFPWTASGRAMTMGATEGLTKVIFDPGSNRVLGVGIVGRGAGEMIAEGVLAVEMGVVAEDLALTMHPHPTLSETEEEAAEVYLGSAVHLISPKRQ